jgi:hypothetical protein
MQPPLPDADKLVTIQQGVYGITTSQDDVGDHPVLPMGGFSILVYGDLPPVSVDTGVLPIAPPPLVETRSDPSGFYQLELDARRYVFCTSFLRCIWLEVSPGQRVRLDYEYSVGPGWSPGDPVKW